MHSPCQAVGGGGNTKRQFHLPPRPRPCACRFDFSGNGESEGHFKFANYTAEVGDVKAAKDYLEQQEGQKVVGLLGEGRGGRLRGCLSESSYGTPTAPQ